MKIYHLITNNNTNYQQEIDLLQSYGTLDFNTQNISPLSKLNYYKAMKILADEWDLKTPVIISKTKNGKPYLKNNPLPLSFSHSNKEAVFSIATTNHGIDIERERKIPNNLIQRFFSPACIQFLSNHPNPQWAALNIWTQQEALAKLLDLPLTNIIRDIEINETQIHYIQQSYFSTCIQTANNHIITMVSAAEIKYKLHQFYAG